MVSPSSHPNAFGGLSAGGVASFIVYEAQERFGVSITEPEATMFVTAVIAAYLFLGRRRREPDA